MNLQREHIGTQMAFWSLSGKSRAWGKLENYSIWREKRSCVQAKCQSCWIWYLKQQACKDFLGSESRQESLWWLHLCHLLNMQDKCCYHKCSFASQVHKKWRPFLSEHIPHEWAIHIPQLLGTLRSASPDEIPFKDPAPCPAVHCAFTWIPYPDLKFFQC